MERFGRIAAIAVLAVVPWLVGCALTDGPVGLFPGGELRSGALVEDRAAEVPFEGPQTMIELQTAAPPRSRTMALFRIDGELYVQAELGYISRRLPWPQRWVLGAIRGVKSWHEDALEDGRVVIRLDGNRYSRRAVKVADPEQFLELCEFMDGRVAEMLGEPLPPAPCDPDSIWFFRLDPA